MRADAIQIIRIMQQCANRSAGPAAAFLATKIYRAGFLPARIRAMTTTSRSGPCPVHRGIFSFEIVNWITFVCTGPVQNAVHLGGASRFQCPGQARPLALYSADGLVFYPHSF
jgi:hypothetical protein